MSFFGITLPLFFDHSEKTEGNRSYRFDPLTLSMIQELKDRLDCSDKDAIVEAINIAIILTTPSYLTYILTKIHVNNVNSVTGAIISQTRSENRKQRVEQCSNLPVK